MTTMKFKTAAAAPAQAPAAQYTPPSTAAQFQTTPAPTAAPAQPAAPAVNPMFRAMFAKLKEAQKKEDYDPKLMPAAIVRDPSKPTMHNNRDFFSNWVLWAEAYVGIEILSCAMDSTQAKQGDPPQMFVRVKGIVHAHLSEPASDTPLGPFEHTFWFSNFDYINQIADFISAVHNFPLLEPDPSTPGEVLSTRRMAEAVDAANPLNGKFVVAKVWAEQAKKPSKKSGPLIPTYINVNWYPVAATKNADGTVEFAEVEDARSKK
jgi:hypothetical protein